MELLKANLVIVSAVVYIYHIKIFEGKMWIVNEIKQSQYVFL